MTLIQFHRCGTLYRVFFSPVKCLKFYHIYNPESFMVVRYRSCDFNFFSNIITPRIAVKTYRIYNPTRINASCLDFYFTLRNSIVQYSRLIRSQEWNERYQPSTSAALSPSGPFLSTVPSLITTYCRIHILIVIELFLIGNQKRINKSFFDTRYIYPVLIIG